MRYSMPTRYICMLTDIGKHYKRGLLIIITLSFINAQVLIVLSCAPYYALSYAHNVYFRAHYNR